MKKQNIYTGEGAYSNIFSILNSVQASKIMLICGKSYDSMYLKEYINALGLNLVRFSGFSANPLYEEVKEGVKLFRNEKCDFILSVGGGSAIDVAKCIKLFSSMVDSEMYLSQKYKANKILHLSIPSTAGTGSESTRFAVIYYKDEKQSISHESIVPEYVILEPILLKTLPNYQKKSTFLDALCQSIEALWSVNANEKSHRYAVESIKLILYNYQNYLKNDLSSSEKMLVAANLSGKAINITQTTAAHAMSYKITSLYGLSHGHAVAICLPYVWKFIFENSQKSNEVKKVMECLNKLFGFKDTYSSITFFEEMLKEMEMSFKKSASKKEINLLVESINIERLKNTPVTINKEELKEMYTKIFE